MLILIAEVLAFLTWTCHTLDNVNVMSRMATVESLVEMHSFAIDRTHFADTIDKVRIGGHFYSEKPPLLSVLGAAVYAPLHLLGLNLRRDSLFVSFALTFTLLGLSFLLCLGCLHDAVLRAGLSLAGATWMTVMLALGTLCLTFNVTFNNHGFVASWIFIGFYGWLRATHFTGDASPAGSPDPATARSRRRWLWMSGVSFALAVGADHSTVIFFAAFFAYALARRDLRRDCLAMLLPVAVVLGATAAFNYAISGSPMPVQIHAEYFHYPGSYWDKTPERLSGISYNSPRETLNYAAQALFGGNGFLLYCPLTIVALWAAARRIARRDPLWIECALALGATLVFVAYYLVSTSNFSGCSYSIRWFVSFIPLLWFFAFSLFLERRPARRLVQGSVLALVFAASLMVAVVGCWYPWPCARPAFSEDLHRWRVYHHVTGHLWDY